jgi:superfamily I DNA and/or RNA helicase
MDEAADRQLLDLDRHAAPVRYQSTATSVQVLADTVNRFGTCIKTHCGEDAWVGSPLRVHRRCVNPMFSISNALAYNGTMVLGRGKGICIDISGTEGNRQHYVPAQGEMALSILRAYMANGWVDELKHKGLPAVYVISPFKSVANEFSALLRRTWTQWASDVAKRTFDKWLKASVGTVHTFQGKEQETIVFLLGGANDGAIQLMARSPNVINVAVTRAQRRLYVVGDRTRWTKWELAALMGNWVDTVPAGIFGTWLRRAEVSTHVKG